MSQNQSSPAEIAAYAPPSAPVPSVERKVPPHLKRLYAATVPFGLGCGISLGLTPLHLLKNGYTEQDLGTLSLFFASGLVLASLPVGALIRRFSPERILALSLLGYALSLIAFPYASSYQTIALVRFFDGAFTVGVWVGSETVLLQHARKEYKAYLTTLYAIWLASGYVLGSFSTKGLNYFVSDNRISFTVGALFEISAAIFVLRFMPKLAPTVVLHEEESSDALAPKAPPMSASSILWRIKTSCFAAFSYGYFQASVVILLPSYLIKSKGFAEDSTTIFPGLFCLGMLLCSNIAGRIADQVGHLKTVRGLSTIGLLAVLGFIFLDAYWAMCVIVFISGATFASMSPIALALTGAVIKPQDYSRANSIYNGFYASGIFLGPPISSTIFQRWGGIVMLEHIVVLWTAFVIFTVIFINDDPASRRGHKNGLPAAG